LSRARIASAAGWLRARLSGDLYGIAVLDRAPHSFVRSETLFVNEWLQIPPSKGFLADPFFWPGRPGLLLCETYAHSTGRGHLEAIALNNARIGEVAPVSLGLECHLSYPFAWMDEGRILCVPEMAGANRQMLFELREGKAAAPAGVIAENIRMADPTVMKLGDCFWLAYTDMDIGPYNNLCLMFAHAPSGPWHAHPGNPVKLDVRSSRPGGTPFWVGNALFRPAQDCSRTYGGALVINRVKTCTPDHYEEEPIATLRPDPAGPYPDGVHTLSFGHGHAAIDGKRISYHPAILFHKLRRRLVGKTATHAHASQSQDGSTTFS
jgi:hypothetical protein